MAFVNPNENIVCLIFPFDACKICKTSSAFLLSYNIENNCYYENHLSAPLTDFLRDHSLTHSLPFLPYGIKLYRVYTFGTECVNFISDIIGEMHRLEVNWCEQYLLMGGCQMYGM